MFLLGFWTFFVLDQKFDFGGLVRFRNSCLNYVFCHSKVIRLHAILHDAAGAVGTHSGKGSGYCYMIGQGPKSCLLGQRIWLLLYDWTRTKVLFAWSREWNTPLLLRKTLSALHFDLCQILKQYVFDCTRYRANWEKYNWRTGTFYWWFSTRIFIFSANVF